MGIKRRIEGSLAGGLAGGMTRAERVAQAELNTRVVAPVVFLPVTRRMTGLLAKSLRKAKRQGDAYHGKLGGRDVSIINTGVGAPSAEGKVVACLGLGARVLLRVDICGGLDPELKIGDLIVASRAVPFDHTTRLAGGGEDVPASPWLLELAAEAGEASGRGAKVRRAAVATVDTFHHQTDDMHREWGTTAAAVDMETSIVYHLARRAGAHALAVMAVSDVRLAGLDPFAEGFKYEKLLRGLDEVAALAVEIVNRMPDPPPLRGGV